MNGLSAAASYRCTFPRLITSWRKAFQPRVAAISPRQALYFGFIQISGFCCAEYNTCDVNSGRHEDQSGGAWAALRDAQMSATLLPMVGWSTNADRAQGCDVHPPAKQDCARRLANSALALVYNESIAWRSPRFLSQVALPSGSVTITLSDISPKGLKSVFPFNYQHTRGASGTGPEVPIFDCAAHDKAGPGTCAWAAVKLANAGWVNATITVLSGSSSVKFTPQINHTVVMNRPIATAYGWGSVPMLSLYDAETELPVIGWNETIA